MPEPIPEWVPSAVEIAEINEQEQAEKERQRKEDGQRPRLEIPTYDPRKPKTPEGEGDNNKRGVIIIDSYNNSL